MEHVFYPLYTNVCTPRAMTATALQMGTLGKFSDELSEALCTLLRVVRAQELTFFVGARFWETTRQRRIAVTKACIVAVGRTTFTSEKHFALLVDGGTPTPLFKIATTLTAVDSSLRKSVPLPSSIVDLLRASCDSRDKPPLRNEWPHRPDTAFCLPLIARYTESDAFAHVNQSQYAVWMEEARATAHAIGAFGPEVGKLAALPPSRFVVEYEGQAIPGDKVQVWAWWCGESFCFEVERDGHDDAGRGRHLLTRGRAWVSTPEAVARL
eukprot:TRINITY_DN40955_c0_g1_i1.p1 TRINITY_DN40955_c0_g1~~TRINITY_DN40955_c0_g1_i1.p1  ORF type:complete len:306 (-),score=17.40 TRINITY_DN40955_c0_g1_i1:57-860(-)